MTKYCWNFSSRACKFLRCHSLHSSVDFSLYCYSVASFLAQVLLAQKRRYQFQKSRGSRLFSHSLSSALWDEVSVNLFFLSCNYWKLTFVFTWLIWSFYEVFETMWFVTSGSSREGNLNYQILFKLNATWISRSWYKLHRSSPKRKQNSFQRHECATRLSIKSKFKLKSWKKTSQIFGSCKNSRVNIYKQSLLAHKSAGVNRRFQFHSFLANSVVDFIRVAVIFYASQCWVNLLRQFSSREYSQVIYCEACFARTFQTKKKALQHNEPIL